MTNLHCAMRLLLFFLEWVQNAENKFIFILGDEKLSFVSLFSLAPINFSLPFRFEIFYVIQFLDLEAYQTNQTGC